MISHMSYRLLSFLLCSIFILEPKKKKNPKMNELNGKSKQKILCIMSERIYKSFELHLVHSIAMTYLQLNVVRKLRKKKTICCDTYRIIWCLGTFLLVLLIAFNQNGKNRQNVRHFVILSYSSHSDFHKPSMHPKSGLY